MKIKINNGKYSCEYYDGSSPKRYVLDKGNYRLNEKMLDSLVTMYYIPLSSINSIKPTKAKMKSTQIQNEDTMDILIPAGKEFKLKNEQGDYLEFSNDEFDGNMTIYDIQNIVLDNNSQIKIKTNKSRIIECIPLEEEGRISVYNEDKYYSVSSENAENIKIDFENGIVLEGDDYSFEASLTRNNDNIELVSFAGVGKDNVSIIDGNSNNINIDSKSIINDLKVSVIDKNKEDTILENASGGNYSISIKNNIVNRSTTEQNTSVAPKITTKSSNIIVPKPSLKKIKAKKKSLKVTWKKAKGVNGYKFQYSRKKNFKKAKTITIRKPSVTQKVIKKLKRKKKYYIRIKAYKLVGGKVYESAWSRIKRKKTK